ncbi:MAG: domain, G-beta repeat [Lacunisphaera sp.]|nr:domain, G-beta repeat [Lacunisphaera sp.]
MQFAKHWAATLDDYVIDLAWSPDGALLAAASQSGGITLFDAATGAIRHTLAGHEDGTNCLAWMPPPVAGVADPGQPGSTSPVTILATGGQDGCVRFWDATTGKQTAETKLGTAWVEHLAWQVGRVIPNAPGLEERRIKDNPPCLFAAAGKKLVALNAAGSIAHTFPDAPKSIAALAMSPVAGVVDPGPGSTSPAINRIAAAYFGGVCLWDTATFASQKEIPYGNAILALTWSPDGRWLVAGCHDNAVHLWVPAEDLELHMSGYETKLKELSFSRDSKWLATGGGRDACVWDCIGAGPEGREPLLLPHKARVCAVAFQNQHSLLASAAADGEFCLWSPSRKNPLVAEVKMPAAATRFAWRPDDSLLAVGTEKGALFVFKTE